MAIIIPLFYAVSIDNWTIFSKFGAVNVVDNYCSIENLYFQNSALRWQLLLYFVSIGSDVIHSNQSLVWHPHTLFYSVGVELVTQTHDRGTSWTVKVKCESMKVNTGETIGHERRTDEEHKPAARLQQWSKSHQKWTKGKLCNSSSPLITYNWQRKYFFNSSFQY